MAVEQDARKVRRWENAHIVLWLLKDTSWLMSYKTIAMCMAIPTLSMAIAITWLSRGKRSQLAHNLSVTLWICANIVWMIGEFYYDDSLRPQAAVFFFCGLAVLVIYYGLVVYELLRQKKTV